MKKKRKKRNRKKKEVLDSNGNIIIKCRTKRTKPPMIMKDKTKYNRKKKHKSKE
jgi:hypothetical protein